MNKSVKQNMTSAWTIVETVERERKHRPWVLDIQRFGTEVENDAMK